MYESSFLELYHLLKPQPNSQDDTLKRCRLCGRVEPEVLFTQKAHSVPDCLGRNDSASVGHECDQCNAEFSSLENHLAAFLQPYLTLLRVETKNGIPNFQSRNDNRKGSSVFKATDENHVNMWFGQNTNDFEYDYENKILTVRSRKRAYIPFRVYQAFIKIFVSNCQELTTHERQLFYGWLKASEDDHRRSNQKVYAFEQRSNIQMVRSPNVHIYKQKHGYTNLPEYILMLRVATFTYFVFVPVAEQSTDLSFESFTINTDLKVIDLSSLNKLKEDKEIGLSFQQIISTENYISTD